jgi:hypothetical protein
MLSIAAILYCTVITNKSTIQGILAFTHIPNFLTSFLTIAITQLCGIPITATTNIKTINDKTKLEIDLVHTYKRMKMKFNMNVSH